MQKILTTRAKRPANIPKKRNTKLCNKKARESISKRISFRMIKTACSFLFSFFSKNITKVKSFFPKKKKKKRPTENKMRMKLMLINTNKVLKKKYVQHKRNTISKLTNV